ncbi:MAG: hypothetical protein IJU82_02135 [Ruminiclostridium sp.]|nr:hypothetical protein [Ruminiclostridium sp.]
MTKEVKIPMIVGIILYAAALLIDLIAVFAQEAVFDFMGASNLRLDSLFFPYITVCQIIDMAMFIAFYLVMLTYKGSERRVVGIVMIVVYCVTNAAMPYIEIPVNQVIAGFQGADGVSASATLKNFISISTSLFVIVSTVFVLIAIGRYGIIKKENNAEMLQYNENERTKEND